MKSTLTIRKSPDGKITSITAKGSYARTLFNSLKPVTVATPAAPEPSKEPTA